MPKALDAQLNLHGEGLLVEHVSKDGPAAKAGIEANDVLLAVDGMPLKEAGDLEAALNEGKEISLKVLRGGKPLTISVTPAKREDERLHLRPDSQDIERAIREKLKEAGISDLSFNVMLPGRFAPPGFHVGPELPDDVSVTIRKQGKQPAEAEVKRGDQSWTVKDSDVSSLPEELRALVEALLKHGEPFRVHSLPHIMIAPPAKPAAPQGAQGVHGPPERSGRR